MYFKRNNELIEKVNALIAESNNEELKNTLTELKSRYESSTYKDWGDRSEFFNDMVDIMVNDFGFDDKGLAEKMANTHPTLQQNFMRMVYMFINNMAPPCLCALRQRQPFGSRLYTGESVTHRQSDATPGKRQHCDGTSRDGVHRGREPDNHRRWRTAGKHQRQRTNP